MKIKDKFGIELAYKQISNLCSKQRVKKFGDPSEDANSLKDLCMKILGNVSGFYFNYKINDKQVLKSLFFSTKSMHEGFKLYNNLLIMDTIFSANRFRMPLLPGTVVDNEGKTMLTFFSLAF